MRTWRALVGDLAEGILALHASYLIRQNPCASMPSATLNFERLLGRIAVADISEAHECRSWQIAAVDATQAQPVSPQEGRVDPDSSSRPRTYALRKLRRDFKGSPTPVPS